MENFHPNDFIVVEGEDGVLQTSDGICLQRKTDGKLYFVQPTKALLESFNLQWLQNSEAEESKRSKWSKEAIMLLINRRINYDKEFKSTVSKNDVTWRKISSELKAAGYNMSSTQCNDKWRYLKARYSAKKDNMGDRGSGEEAIGDFPYFAVMDEFLRKNHNITPIAIASSSQGDKIPDVDDCKTVTECSDHDDDEAGAIPTKRPKRVQSNVTKHVKGQKGGLKVILDEMKQSSMARERRHQEIMETRNKAIDVFSAKMDLLVETLKK